MTGPASEIEPKDVLLKAIDGLEERLALCRTKSDTINRPDTREKSQALIERLRQVRQDLEYAAPGSVDQLYQDAQRITTEIAEDCDTLERGTGVSPR